ncbi:hypothetical protein [Pediococcus cellicola]|nr:hypothetical protein [Pediococcus cellicola]GEL15605.1 hypothetical protein PCE01_14070 [Pediococcus cellicola]
MVHLIYTGVLTIIGLLCIFIPLWLLMRANKSISMKILPTEDNTKIFYTYVWFYETGKLEVLNGEAYQVGKQIQATNAGKYVIKKVKKESLFMGMQRKYEFVLN